MNRIRLKKVYCIESRSGRQGSWSGRPFDEMDVLLKLFVYQNTKHLELAR